MSEALRLADLLEERSKLFKEERYQAAAELRRLHAKCEALTADTLEEMDRITEIHRLRALNAELVEALKWIGDHDLKGCDLVVAGHMAHGFIGRARAALEKVEEDQEVHNPEEVIALSYLKYGINPNDPNRGVLLAAAKARELHGK